MAGVQNSMSDAEWEAKFNGPRDRLLKKIFGDSKTSESSKSAEASKSAKLEPVK